MGFNTTEEAKKILNFNLLLFYVTLRNYYICGMMESILNPNCTQTSKNRKIVVASVKGLTGICEWMTSRFIANKYMLWPLLECLYLYTMKSSAAYFDKLTSNYFLITLLYVKEWFQLIFLTNFNVMIARSGRLNNNVRPLEIWIYGKILWPITSLYHLSTVSVTIKIM